MVFMWLIARAVQGFKGITGALLQAKPILFVGKISYGIYLYHFFMLSLVRYLANALRLRQPGILLDFFVRLR